ncbi:MAG: hypothetical protein ABIP39_02910 [Polyangiaceae bacterium]
MRGKLSITLVVAVCLLAPDARADDDSSLYGGFGLAGTLEPGGSGNELETHCSDLGAASCGTPIPIGGALFGYVGIARKQLGLEVMLGAMGDLHRPSASFDGAPHTPYGNPLISMPKREESFIILRGGGLLAVRGRYTSQTARLRKTIAAGIGASYKQMALEREVTSDTGLEDRPYFPSGAGYFSPALSFDGALQYRASSTTAVSFGLFVWMETAWSGAKAPGDPHRILAGEGGFTPVATPEYRMASGLQIFIGPYIGVQFGP